MSWKPWQVWTALTLGALGLIMVVLFMLDLVPAGVIWLVTIIAGTFGAIIAALDRRARKQLQDRSDG